MTPPLDPEDRLHAAIIKPKPPRFSPEPAALTGALFGKRRATHRARWSDAAYLRGRGSWVSKLMLFLRIREVKNIIADLSGSFPRRFLDIGAADGLAAEIIAAGNEHWEFYGIERSHELIRFSTPKQVTLLQGDARSLPLADDSIGVALFMSSFKHIFRSHEALAETHRILSDDGYVIFIEPSPWFIQLGARFGKFDLGHIPNNWSFEKYESELASAGFTTIERRRFAWGLYQVVMAKKSPFESVS